MFKKLFCFFVLIAGLNSTSNAGGFQVNLQGVSQASMGGTGIALPQDNAILYYNPGALVYNKTSGISSNLMGVSSKATFQPFNNALGTVQSKNPIGTPFSIYLTTRCKSCGDSSKWAAGIGVYTPYGSTIKWDNNWTGRYIIQSISLKTVFIQPTISMVLNRLMSVGVGSLIAYSNLEVNKALPIASASSLYGQANLQAKGNGIGFVVGLYYNLHPNFHLGFVIRTPVGLGFSNGKASFTSIPGTLKDSFPETRFTSSIILPGSIAIGNSYTFHKNWVVNLDAKLTFWKVYDSLKVKFEHTNTLLQNSISPKMYRNSFTISSGVQYTIKRYFFRGGITYDQSAVLYKYAGPDVPDGNKMEYSTGFGLKSGSAVVNIFMMYVSTINMPFNNLETQLRGTIQTNALIFGLGGAVSF